MLEGIFLPKKKWYLFQKGNLLNFFFWRGGYRLPCRSLTQTSPLKSHRNPKRSRIVFQLSFFRGRFPVKLQGCKSFLGGVTKNDSDASKVWYFPLLPRYLASFLGIKNPKTNSKFAPENRPKLTYPKVKRERLPTTSIFRCVCC